MNVDIWSDIACPWCFIGKRRFERALAEFPHRDEVTVTWHSYQLDPTIPEHYDGSELDYLAKVKRMDPAQVRGMLDPRAVVPIVAGPNGQEAIDLVRTAESNGFDAVWVAESYGSDVTIPIPVEERTSNPLFTGCIDRGA